MSIKTHLCLAVFALACEPVPAFSEETDLSRRGLVDDRPASGPYVATEQGFMIPYQQRIPGTDITFEMVPIRGGEFQLGSPDSEPERQPAEGPQVSVVVPPFWMGKHEVTWKEYQTYMGLADVFRDFERRKLRPVTGDNKVDSVTAPSLIYDLEIPYGGGKDPDSPAVTMTQFAAMQYTKWLSLLLSDFYRLPSEAEWEYACRAGTSTAYSFGDDTSKLSDYAWFLGNSDEQRHRVGSKRPNAWGLHDMHGNVAEWVLDGYRKNGYLALDGEVINAEDAIQWPTEVPRRIARGGSWELDADALRSAARLPSNENWSDEDPHFPTSPFWHTSLPATGVGLRLMRPLNPPATADKKARYWGEDDKQMEEILEDCIENSGRGARGIVGSDLPEAIRSLKESGP